MTAVVGLLNKKGVALAADSAVTRTRGFNEKVTKNGNKMVRLSNAVPVSVMLTGNGDFMRTQWDIIIRHYREHRGDIKHDTVESCMYDFFRYIADHGLFVKSELVIEYLQHQLSRFFEQVEGNLDEKFKKRDTDGRLVSPKSTQKAIEKVLDRLSKKWLKDGICPQFQDYTQESFHDYTKDIFDEFIVQHIYEDDDPFTYGCYPSPVMKALREPLEKAFMVKLTTRREYDDGYAELVFSGYGDKQSYPSLVSTIVCEGFDGRVNYHVRPEDIICISDERPAAICPFAQKDVIRSILRGIHRNYGRELSGAVNNSFSGWGNVFFNPCDDENINYSDFVDKLGEFKTDDLSRNFFRQINRLIDHNLQQWEKALVDYDLQSMAALAESLIDLTGFHRILTFQQEGVGGPVDLAVITKNDGFTWLNRKSWYHHKDVGGRYGKLGV